MSDLSAAVATVETWLEGRRPRIAIVLGSGLGGLLSSVGDSRRLSYRQIPGFPVPTVAGHRGQLVVGTLQDQDVLLQSGRFHLYEGHSPKTAALPVRVFAQVGIETLMLTNAAGGVRPGLRPPSLMLIADHINLMWRSAIVGPVEPGEHRFPDMSNPYSPHLRRVAREAALAEGIPLEEGVYLGLLGPSYETPAEIRMLRRIGADAVGMSTVPEATVARARGMRVMGISTITNLAAGISPHRLSHDEVLRAGKQVAGDLEQLLAAVVRRLSQSEQQAG